MKKKICLGVLITLTALGGACNRKEDEGASIKEARASEKPGATRRGDRRGSAREAIPVRVVTISPQDLPSTVTVVAVLEGRKQADVYARVSGKIASIGPAAGKRVKEGEVLFTVDRSDPGESFLATPVISPISGWVGRWMINSIGAPVVMQQPVVSVVDDEALRAMVGLPTQEWLEVSETTPVHVKLNKDMRSAQVIGIARSAESSSARGTITIEVANADHKWKAGMVVHVTFDLNIKPRIVIPTSSLAITDQGSFVFVVQDGVAHRTPVKFAVVDNDHVEIIEGLESGLAIISEGISQVGNGVSVNIVSNDEETKI